VPALVIACLAGLESLLSAVIADGMTGTKHNSNSELMGVGVGNILAGLTAGIPATAAVARTAVNIQSGAKTPLAAIMHAVLIILYVLFLTPIISYISMASLAALLINISYYMSHHHQFIRIIKIAPKSDVIVLLICFFLTTFIDMIAGIVGAVILSCLLLTKNIANLTSKILSHASTGHHHKTKHLNLPKNVMVYHLNGALFFANASKLTDISELIMDYITVLIIDMEAVPLIDMSGLVAIKNMILDLQSKNKSIIICGARAVTTKILQKLPINSRHQVKLVDDLENAVNVI
jgi:SulP family sulfate permease